MMANAQRMIEERKRALGAMVVGSGLPPPGIIVPPVRVLPTIPTLATEPERSAAAFEGTSLFRVACGFFVLLY